MSTKKEKPLFKEAPKDYSCTEEGVFVWKEDKDGNREKDWITFSPVGVVAISRDESSGNWGIVVKWLDLDGEVHEQAIPKKLLHTYGTELAQRLVDSGLDLIPGKEKALLIYLSRFRPKDRVVAASSTGWLGESFVLPERTLREPEGLVIVYQPAGLSNVALAVRSKGSKEEWRAGMVNASPVVVFMVCAALSAPIRFKAGIEGGGFHFYGTTSVGKTTAGQAAASTSGNGVDPAIAGGAEAYTQRWNSTSNALEAKAETFNDLAMVIDEIGEGDGKAFGSTIYRLISGTGRGRANREGNLRDSKTWRAFILSMGELAVSQHIEQSGGSMKGGQLVRMVDIDLSMLPALFPDGDAADAMKKLCATHYGHAVPELIEGVDDLTAGWKDFNHGVIGEAVSGVSRRVRTRFALVAHAGMLASRAGVVPWTEGEVLESAKKVFAAWKNQASVVSDVERGISAVRDFILESDARFERESANQTPVPRYGWFRDRAYHFTTSAFKKACSGADPQRVKRALDDQGMLHRPNQRALNSRIRVDGERVLVVSVLTALLDLVGTSVDSMDSKAEKAEKTTPSTPSTPVHTKYDKADPDLPQEKSLDSITAQVPPVEDF